MGHPISDDIPDSCFQSDGFEKKHKPSSFFNVPGLFVRFCPKSSESDSVKSPTSPLDFRIFSNLTNPFRSPKCSQGGHEKSWDCTKVGLGIVDSLDSEEKNSKNFLFGPQMRIKTQNCIDSFESPKSLPKNYGVFLPTHKIQPSNLQKGNSDVVFGIGENPFDIFGIELSEDYTCVKTYGPNPKTTHIFSDCILECHNNNSANLPKNEEMNPQLPLDEISAAYPSSDFLSSCYSCKKKLEGEDIYMYRGEKAFCSWNCRSREISMEKANSGSLDYEE